MLYHEATSCSCQRYRYANIIQRGRTDIGGGVEIWKLEGHWRSLGAWTLVSLRVVYIEFRYQCWGAENLSFGRGVAWLDVNVGAGNQRRVWISAEGLEISVENESGGLEVSGMIRVNLSCQFLHPSVIKARWSAGRCLMGFASTAREHSIRMTYTQPTCGCLQTVCNW